MELMKNEQGKERHLSGKKCLSFPLLFRELSYPQMLCGISEVWGGMGNYPLQIDSTSSVVRPVIKQISATG